MVCFRLSQESGFSLTLTLDRLSQEASFSGTTIPEHCLPLERIRVVDEILYADFGSRLTLVSLGRVPEIIGYWEDPGTLYLDCPGYVSMHGTQHTRITLTPRNHQYMRTIPVYTNIFLLLRTLARV
jgi:hypothetical protein